MINIDIHYPYTDINPFNRDSLTDYIKVFSTLISILYQSFTIIYIDISLMNHQ